MTNDTPEYDERLLTRREALQGGSAVVATTVGLDALTARAMAQSGGPTDEISGIVEDDNGAVQGATVAAVPHDETLAILEATTAADGTYTFSKSTLHTGDNLYHVIARDGTETDPRRGEQNYPFIAAEGAAAIPDSEDLHARYDVTEQSLNDGDTVSSLIDQTGNGHNLTATGDPQAVANGIGGNMVARTDGTDDLFSGSWSALPQPNHIFIVFQMQTAESEVYLLDGVDSSNRHYIYEQSGSSPWSMNGVLGNSVDSEPHIFSTLYNTTNSTFREDGTQVGSGDAGTDDLTGLTVASHWDGGQYANLDIGEILVYPQDKSGVQSQAEQYLSDKWGVTI